MLTAAMGYARIHAFVLVGESVHYDHWKTLSGCVDHLELLPRRVCWQRRGLVRALRHHIQAHGAFDLLVCNSANMMPALADLPIGRRMLDLDVPAEPGRTDRRAVRLYPFAGIRHNALRRCYVQAARISDTVLVHGHDPHWLPMDRELAGKTRVVPRDDLQAMAEQFSQLLPAPAALPIAPDQSVQPVRRAA